MGNTIVDQVNFEDTAITFEHKSDAALRKARLLFKVIGSPLLTFIGTRLAGVSVRLRIPGAKLLIKKTIYEQFCGGESLSKCKQTVDQLEKYNIGTILDYALEAKETEADFDTTRDNIIKSIEYAKVKKSVPLVSLKLTGLGRFTLLEKVSAGKKLDQQEQVEFQKIQERLDAICLAGVENNTGVFVDAEESWIQQAVDDLTTEMMQRYNKNEAVVYNTIQLYRHDRLEFLKKSFEHARANNYLLAVKIVRGAYMEKERDRAKRMEYESPIQPDKSASDRDYNLAVEFCLDNYNQLALCVASHNEESCKLLAKLIDEKGLERNNKRLFFAQLYGMSDHISFNLAHQGYYVTKYIPYGPVEEVIPYLNRRAQENTSVAGQVGRELQLIHKELKRRKNV